MFYFINRLSFKNVFWCLKIIIMTRVRQFQILESIGNHLLVQYPCKSWSFTGGYFSSGFLKHIDDYSLHFLLDCIVLSSIGDPFKPLLFAHSVCGRSVSYRDDSFFSRWLLLPHAFAVMIISCQIRCMCYVVEFLSKMQGSDFCFNMILLGWKR